jgi:hypothetical protein
MSKRSLSPRSIDSNDNSDNDDAEAVWHQRRKVARKKSLSQSAASDTVSLSPSNTVDLNDDIDTQATVSLSEQDEPKPKPLVSRILSFCNFDANSNQRNIIVFSSIFRKTRER